ncbi:hypothetical protein HanHA300_Chr15g0555191 [Helianthus annuus]|nr:hypothetical protein HanHA300_Chr15g0555191 [Helianthus annuus]KAJ0647760.1 hypothetical protein HanLR1_Chr15g0565241 [Helianthus annuus]
MDVSKLWDKPDRDPVLVRDDQVMFALDFIKSDDTSNVVFGDTEATSHEDVVVRGTEHRFEGSGYVNVPNVKGFTRFGASKAFIHCLTRRMLKVADHPSASEPVQLRDVIEASNIWTLGLRKKHEDLSLVISKESKAAGKKLVSLKGFGKCGEGSTNVNPEEVYVPDWKATVGNSFKYSSICEDVLTHFAPPIVRGFCSSMNDDLMISKVMMGACNLVALLLEGCIPISQKDARI